MKSLRSIAGRVWLALVSVAWAALLVGAASAQTVPRDFDHLRTGFALSGTHANTRCESCHVGGVFKGTPRDCESCHVGGRRFAKGNVVKSAEHFPTQQSCDTCHDSRTFTGARMNHLGVARGSCATCHNGNQASGKPTEHMRTSASCDSCHGTSGWRPASGFDHAGVAPGSCASCHNGVRATGRGSSHIPYTQVTAAASASCDTCHKAGFASWTPAKFHTSINVTTQCGTCHAGIKPNTAIHAGQTVCENCHKSSSSWATAKVDHGTFNAATNCASCHNGQAATGKSGTHVPVGTANCFACHGTTSWKPSSFNHTQVPVAAQCASCHTGTFPPADGKSGSHTPYQLVSASASANCDVCHKAGFASWTPAKFHTSINVTTQCGTCHAGIKPNTAIHVGQTVCENCHKSSSSWATAKVDHGTFNAATNCASCHNGQAATGKSGTHVPVGATNCFACHSVASWKPTKFNHTQVPVAAQCASCHTGTYPPADGKPASHTPYQLVSASASANCDVCHKAGFASWTPAKFHTSINVTTQCGTCHAGIKPNTAIHVGQTVCENCHKSTSSWGTAKVDHGTFNAATNCASCHNGQAATGKSGTHVPVGATNCFACHGVTSWKPTKFNHTQVPVAAQCASCHTGTYPPADGRPSGHVPYQLVAASASANCDTCHKAGFASWTPARFHTNVSVSTQCATCHAAIKPNTAIHVGQTVCENCHKSTSSWGTAKVDHGTFNAATNCASCHNGQAATGKSGTHIPVGATSCFSCHGTTAWQPTKFNHTQVTVAGQCASCHSGAFPPADGKQATHIPYQLVAGAAAANCDTCHKGSFATWANGKFHGNVSVAGQCKTCHAGAYVSQGATAKPGNHIPEAQLLNGAAMECNACHSSTTTWTQKMNHNGSLGGGAGWCKSCHASGTNYLGSMDKKSPTHKTKNPPAIDCSESGCHRPLGNKGNAYTKWD